VRRPVVEAIGGFDETANLKYCEDVDYHARAFRHGGAAFVDRVTLHYRISPTSLMHGQSSADAVRASYRHMTEQYRRLHGRAELAALKVLARTVLRDA